MRVAATVGVPPSARRRRLHLWALYARAILREFRGSLALLGGLMVIGTAVIALSSWQPQPGLRHSFAAAGTHAVGQGDRPDIAARHAHHHWCVADSGVLGRCLAVGGVVGDPAVEVAVAAHQHLAAID